MWSFGRTTFGGLTQVSGVVVEFVPPVYACLRKFALSPLVQVVNMSFDMFDHLLGGVVLPPKSAHFRLQSRN
jgi:hypothetical protein